MGASPSSDRKLGSLFRVPSVCLHPHRIFRLSFVADPMLLVLGIAAPALRSAPLPVGSTSSLRSVQRVAHVVLREDALGPPPAAVPLPPPPPAAATVAPEGGTTADGASLPPDSFLELIEHAAESTRLAISEGSLLLEVEFPPLPVSQLDEPGLRCVTH